MKFIELFAGIGGFRYGLETVAIPKRNERGWVFKCENLPNDRKPQVGTQPFTCVWANENNKYACKIYRKNFGKGELHEGDIRKVRSGTIPEFEMLTAGFPCQSFSIAGKRKGMSGEDTRGTLFYEIYRIARDRQPKLLLLENVPGLLSSKDGEDFYTILRSLDEIGYDVEWDSLNSKNFGVPQSRERVFIVGHLRGGGGRKVFPLGACTKNDGKERGIIQINKPNHAGYRKFNPEGLSPSLRARDRGDDHSSPRIESNMRVRRLTPIECERLQGFPDGWTEGMSDTQRYKCLGNAVTINVIEAIGERIAEVYEGK